MAVNERLRYLIKAYYNGTLSEAEKNELLPLIQTANEEDLAALLYEQWQHEVQQTQSYFTQQQSRELLQDILQTETPLRPMAHTKRLAARIKWMAAACFLLLAVGAVFYTNQMADVRQHEQIALLMNAKPGAKQATLSFDDGSWLALDSLTATGAIMHQGVALAQVDTARGLHFQATKVPVMNTIRTPRGGEYQMVLADGTKIWLNAASSVRFPSTFVGNERRIKVSGEVYMEVAKRANQPFWVETDYAAIQVLGTAFNVNTYNPEQPLQLALMEGAVKISAGSASKLLKPGELATLDDAGSLRVTPDGHIADRKAWVNGFFQFEDMEIAEVLGQMERWYDVRIEHEPNLSTKRLTGRLSRMDRLGAWIEVLRYYGMTCTYHNGILMVTKNTNANQK